MCKKEYAIAKRHSLIGKKFTFPDCSVLPSSDCIHLEGLPLPEPSNKSKLFTLEIRCRAKGTRVNRLFRPFSFPPSDEQCYSGDGSGYRGEIAETVSGKRCSPWNQRREITMNIPELLGGHNFCRNPGRVATKPWCYTGNNVTEACNIPECCK